MQSIPVDTSRLGLILCVVGPEPRMNLETGQVRTDRDGNTLYAVGVVVRQLEGRRAETIEVVVPGQPQGIAEGAPVAIKDLTAVQWQIGGRSGTSFRAAGITPAAVADATGLPVASASAKPKPAAGGER